MHYAAVADLLSEVEPSVFIRLPNAQRAAIDTVLLNGDDEGLKLEQRTVAGAFLAVLETLAADAPVLLAIDDLQWLDASSRAVLTFAARRIKGRVGVLVTERPQLGCPTAMSWLRVGAKNGIGYILLGPLSTGGLHTLILGRLGRSLPRPTMLRIAEISQGNPYYALELARAAGAEPPTVGQQLPRALADVVRAQIGELDDEVRDVLLSAACATSPTVDLLAQANAITAAEAVVLLENAESKGIIAIQGNRVRFTHPLLARGVYTDARPSWRRKVHGALAEAEVLPEVRARHRALAATSHDPATLSALDAAADAARARGAPSAAAELLELAIRLGGDTPRRRIRASRNHFHAGNFRYARSILEPCLQSCLLVRCEQAQSPCLPKSTFITTASRRRPSCWPGRQGWRRRSRTARADPAVVVVCPDEYRRRGQLYAHRKPSTGADRRTRAAWPAVRRAQCGSWSTSWAAKTLTLPGCGTRSNWKSPTPRCQLPSVPALLAPWCSPGRDDWMKRGGNYPVSVTAASNAPSTAT